MFDNALNNSPGVAHTRESGSANLGTWRAVCSRAKLLAGPRRSLSPAGVDQPRHFNFHVRFYHLDEPRAMVLDAAQPSRVYSEGGAGDPAQYALDTPYGAGIRVRRRTEAETFGIART